MSHAQFWVFPLSRRNLKDALSEHHPAEGGRVGALAGLKVSPLQNLQPNWQFESIVEALTPSAAKQYLSRRIDILSEFRVNHAQSCSFPLSRLKVKEATSLQPQLLHVDRQVSKSDGSNEGSSKSAHLAHPSEGLRLGSSDGSKDGSSEGSTEGSTLGSSDGSNEGSSECSTLGSYDGSNEGSSNGAFVGALVGDVDGTLVGSLSGPLVEVAPDGLIVNEDTSEGTADGLALILGISELAEEGINDTLGESEVAAEELIDNDGSSNGTPEGFTDTLGMLDSAAEGLNDTRQDRRSC